MELTREDKIKCAESMIWRALEHDHVQMYAELYRNACMPNFFKTALNRMAERGEIRMVEDYDGDVEVSIA